MYHVLYYYAKKNLVKRECEEFEMVLQHKSKLHVYKILKCLVGFEEYCT